jgi:hypothetical protein
MLAIRLLVDLVPSPSWLFMPDMVLAVSAQQPSSLNENNPLILRKILVLQQLYDPSYKGLEF